MKKEDLPNILPVFPLSNFIIFPRTTVPLNIFEPRYIQMVDQCMKSSRIIGMIQPKKTGELKKPDLYRVGCAGKITSFNETNDGRYLIILNGICRFKVIEEINSENLYRECEVKYEDLVRKPNMVQEEMKTRFGLESYAKFSDYPDYVEDWVFDWNVSVLARRGIEEAKNNYGKRKVSDKSVGKDLEAYKTICSDLEINQFEACLRSLSYT